MQIKPTDWQEAWTLEAYVIDLIKKKETQSEAFQTLLRIYGREKLEVIWKKYKGEK